MNKWSCRFCLSRNLQWKLNRVLIFANWEADGRGIHFPKDSASTEGISDLYIFTESKNKIILENITIDGNKILFWLSFMDQSRDKKILN